MALLGGKNWRNGAAVSFPDWRDALERVVTERERAAYVRAILGFLRHCKSVRAPATIMRAKEYIEAYEKQENCRLEAVRAALRWFFRTAESRRQAESAGDKSASVAGAEPGKLNKEQEVVVKAAMGAVGADEVVGVSRNGRRGGVVPRGADDLGGADWERDLIVALRRKGVLWRTEQTLPDVGGEV